MSSLPRGMTVGTCAIAIDINSAQAQGIASWANLYDFLQALVNVCAGEGYGGSAVASEFVFVVVNPLLVDVANTCMGPQGHRRMDVRQCVQSLAARNTHVGPGGASTSVAGAGAGAGASGAGPADAGGAIAGRAIAGGAIAGGASTNDMGTGGMSELVRILTVAGSASGTSPTASSITTTSRSLVALEISITTTISTPSVASTTGGTGGAGVGLVVQSCILPPVPSVTVDTIQEVYLLGSTYRIGGTWVMKNNQWSPGKRQRTWQALGYWYLMCGLGPPVPFPSNPVPVWPGNTVQIVVGRAGQRLVPISEAWIAENGKWTALNGLVPQPDEWIRSGGWVLLRGMDRGVLSRE
ncbi:hypothetical protein MMC17_007422 [Xylographa soralifera]|nr:hypothetical protein [Xylographa soralifera]